MVERSLRYDHLKVVVTRITLITYEKMEQKKLGFSGKSEVCLDRVAEIKARREARAAGHRRLSEDMSTVLEIQCDRH